MSKDASLSFDPAALPDDSALLKRFIVQRERQLLSERAALIAQIKKEAARQIEALRERMEAREAEHAAELKAAVAAILRRYYGPRSERFDPRQLLLFGQVVEQLPLDEASIAQEAGEQLVTRRVKNRHNHGRQQLPECLERLEIEHGLDDKACPACGCERSRIGAEVSEQLEYFPASFKVLKHVRPKYACAKCDREGYGPNIQAAPKPPQPIDGGLPGPSLLAYVVVSKLGDHLPLYRLENIFARQRVHVARGTMCGWMRAAGELVQPLVESMMARVKRSRVIHTDDTPVPIQSPGAKQCRKGRVWCYLGDEANPYTVYDYTPSRSRDGPAKWLTGFTGYLQADAYGGYDGIFAGGQVTEVACWAHASRKFYDALHGQATLPTRDSHGRRRQLLLESLSVPVHRLPEVPVRPRLPAGTHVHRDPRDQYSSRNRVANYWIRCRIGLLVSTPGLVDLPASYGLDSPEPITPTTTDQFDNRPRPAQCGSAPRNRAPGPPQGALTNLRKGSTIVGRRSAAP